MALDFSIVPDGVYDDGALVLGLGVTHAALAQARREGELRYTRKGRRRTWDSMAPMTCGAKP